MANRIRLFHLQVLLIVLLSNGGSFFAVNGLSSKDRRQDTELWEVDNDGTVDNAEIQQSLEYLMDLIEQMMQSLNAQDFQPGMRPYPGTANTPPWNMRPASMEKSNCSPNYPEVCIFDPYRKEECRRDINFDPPPIEPMERSKLRQFTLPQSPALDPTDIYKYFGQNDFPGLFDPYSDDSHIPVNPPPIYGTDDWDIRPIFPKLDPQSPSSPPNTPWPPIFLDNLPARSIPRRFRNKPEAESDPSERAQAFFWPWNQNRPKQKPHNQPRETKQATFDAQYIVPGQSAARRRKTSSRS